MADSDPQLTPAAPIRRRTGRIPVLSRNVILSVCKLIAKGLTETAACDQLDIKVSTWANWKARKGREVIFANILSRAYADREALLIGGIEDAATIGDEKRGKDWRAGAWLLERTPGSRERWNPAAQQAGGTTIINIGTLSAVVGLPPRREERQIAEGGTPQVVVEVESEVKSNPPNAPTP